MCAFELFLFELLIDTKVGCFIQDQVLLLKEVVVVVVDVDDSTSNNNNRRYFENAQKKAQEHLHYLMTS